MMTKELSIPKEDLTFPMNLEAIMATIKYVLIYRQFVKVQPLTKTAYKNYRTCTMRFNLNQTSTTTNRTADRSSQ